MTDPERDVMLAGIARRYLFVETLERRYRDRLDFYDVAVWSLKDALIAAFDAGRTQARTDR
ncbi:MULTISPECIES: DUF6900 domain-containing protein [Burkholderia cepacia complex]|uniref:DUF6900 domain-containing protein n=1 Tax=Burkholderia cepacia complex TaxID=87882 RepID=UPI00158CBA72|nr:MULTISPECIES: hypothetical protein [Burkholderia cepacia complex]MBR8426401.1 hypothetical protein [Burkholderia cenocepacia]MBR8494704.1 hypothetical protein [Burkholderia cenocepacia]MCA8081374.1 hypothetical protein [Burkholderia cepacia]